MRDHPQHLLAAAAFGRADTQVVAQVPLHHAIDGFRLRALPIGFALLRSAELFSHHATIPRCRRLGTGSSAVRLDQRTHF